MITALAGLPWAMIGRGGIIAAALALGYCQGVDRTDSKWETREAQRIAAYNAAELKAMKAAHALDLDQETSRARLEAEKAAALIAAETRAQNAERAAKSQRSRNYALAQDLEGLQAQAAASGDLCGRRDLSVGVREHFADRLNAIYSDRRPAANLRGSYTAGLYSAPIDGNPELAGPPKL